MWSSLSAGLPWSVRRLSMFGWPSAVLWALTCALPVQAAEVGASVCAVFGAGTSARVRCGVVLLSVVRSAVLFPAGAFYQRLKVKLGPGPRTPAIVPRDGERKQVLGGHCTRPLEQYGLSQFNLQIEL